MTQGSQRGHKRANGEGTIARRKDGRWVGAVTLTDGRRKWFYGKTRNDVSRELTKVLREQHQGLPVSSDRIRLDELLQRWLEVKKPALAPLTFDSYEEIARLHITPLLGKLKVSALTPQQVDSLLAAKLAAGLSARRVQYVRAVLRMALNAGIKWGVVGRNVAQLSSSPRVSPREIRPKSMEDVLQVFEAVKDDRLEMLFTLVLVTGLRQGEALGLSWDDLDLQSGTLRVARTLQKLGGQYVLREPKTRQSRRVLCISQRLVQDLHQHRARQLAERLAAGPHWREQGLVFTRLDGQPLEGTSVTKHLKRLLARAGLPLQRFHDLRHDAASLMHANGDDLRTIMLNLGHSTISTTANIYTHVAQETQRRSAERMDQLLARRAR